MHYAARAAAAYAAGRMAGGGGGADAGFRRLLRAVCVCVCVRARARVRALHPTASACCTRAACVRAHVLCVCARASGGARPTASVCCTRAACARAHVFCVRARVSGGVHPTASVCCTRAACAGPPAAAPRTPAAAAPPPGSPASWTGPIRVITRRAGPDPSQIEFRAEFRIFQPAPGSPGSGSQEPRPAGRTSSGRSLKWPSGHTTCPNPDPPSTLPPLPRAHTARVKDTRVRAPTRRGSCYGIDVAQED